MTKHPTRDATLEDLAEHIRTIAREMDAFMDLREGSIEGNELRSIASSVDSVRFDKRTYEQRVLGQP